jgi:transglutaminase-like putative cysteine protease
MSQLVPQLMPLRTLWLLLGGYLGCVALNMHHVAVWCLPLALGAVIWRARLGQTAPSSSRRVLRYTVVIVITLTVLIGFRTLNGIQAGASLLVSMAALKITETSTQRDWLIVIAASVFLLLSACLDAQMLWRLPLYAVELCLLCMGMYALGAGSDLPSTRVLARRAGASIGAALPFALLLFLFVPRLPGSFWALPRQHGAVTGLSDEMSPGGISELSESGEAAARVRFDGAIPPIEQRYWRGFVLHDFDGTTWRRQHVGQSLDFGRVQPRSVEGPTYRYEISLEPTQYPVLLALELPARAPESVDGAYLTADDELAQRQAVDRPINYRLESYVRHVSSGTLTSLERQFDLQMPRQNRNVRSVELALALRQQSDSDIDYVQRVLDYFQHGGFSYTLTPPLQDFASVDSLLFRTHEGFCGHYASAFVFLMRAGGIPSRVVTGYLGGVWNRYGGYLLVRQSDAHAWTEVWLEGRGWVRVDPTAVVAPARLTRGVDDLLSARNTITGRFFGARWISNTVQAWQAVNAWWQDDFVGFNFDRQRGLLERLGIKDHHLRALALLLAIGGGLWLGLIAWSLRPRSWRAEDALTRTWRLLERKLRRAAAPRAPHEGPIAFAQRVGSSRPELAGTLTALARRYARLRYGPAASAAELEQFRRAVRLLRPVPPRAGR